MGLIGRRVTPCWSSRTRTARGYRDYWRGGDAGQSETSGKPPIQDPSDNGDGSNDEPGLHSFPVQNNKDSMPKGDLVAAAISALAVELPGTACAPLYTVVLAVFPAQPVREVLIVRVLLGFAFAMAGSIEI